MCTDVVPQPIQPTEQADISTCTDVVPQPIQPTEQADISTCTAVVPQPTQSSKQADISTRSDVVPRAIEPTEQADKLAHGTDWFAACGSAVRQKGPESEVPTLQVKPQGRRPGSRSVAGVIPKQLTALSTRLDEARWR